MEKKYRIGIDLGGTNVKLGIVDSDNNIIEKHMIPTLTGRPYKEIIKDIVDACFTLLEKANLKILDCELIGIGSPGTIDDKKGIVLYSNNFDWENIPIVDEMKKYINIPIYIDNDANCAALGEVVKGAAKGCKNVILITLGTGVGGGVVIDGKIFGGGFSGGAELGHTTIIVDGEPCTCGRKGCLEAYASATALIRDTKRAAKDKSSLLNKIPVEDIDGKTAFDMAKNGDKIAQNVIDNYIKYLGEGIVNFINVFRPEKVLLSGGICNQKENLTNPLNEYVNKYCFSGDKIYIAKVECATLGNDAGIIGAANL